MGRRLSASERRAQLLRVGRSVFAKRGFEGSTVEAIARKAKVSKPIVYEHFGGKQGLYAVIVDRELREVTGRIAAGLEGGTPRERLERAALAFLTWVQDEPDGFQVLMRDAPTSRASGAAPLLHDVADRVSAVFAEQFHQAGYDRSLAPIYAHALVGMVSFVGEWWIDVRKPRVEQVAAHVAALAWVGLRHLPRQPAPVDPEAQATRRDAVAALVTEPVEGDA